MRWERSVLVFGVTLVIVAVVLFFLGGFAPLTRLVLSVGAGLVVVGVTIVVDNHLRGQR